ncbi:hypothetical protein [Alteromonas confluentis]|uniref:Tip attachment protein J domain-containing protein n=1 Tax=Alteromonas confluentis TaxID=1656094 RepID=A0A1E7ZE85_9ALTE|nr:hypothetical protein [Alteromonas confluentis]OFC71823.1 hypothetical protein BFC18_06620 [Alteromonas confluentis]
MPVVAVGVAAGMASAAAGITIAGATVFASAVAIGVGTAIGTQLLTDAMTPELGTLDTNPAADQALTTQGNQSRKIVYGEALVGGQIVGYAKPTIAGTEWHVMVLHLVGHPCESVEVYEIEGKKLSEFGSKARVRTYLGDQTSVDNTAKTHIPGWTDDHIGTNQTYVVVEIENDPNLVAGTINEMKFVVRGHRVYDPRKDDTAGGSGAHRVNDSATWEWSDNPELCAYHALMTYGGKAVPQRRIPWDFVAVCANYTDELATYRDKDGNEQQGQRFGCNGVLNNGMRPNELLNQIMLTMGAKLYRVGGRVFIKPAMYAGPATTTIHVNDLRELPRYTPHRKYSELTNFIRPEYVEPELKWQVTSAPVVTSEAYRAADKAHLESTIRANLVTKSHQIQRLAKLQLERNRAGFVTSYPLDGLRLDIAAGNDIRFVDPQSGINKEFLIASTDYDTAKRRTLLTLVEDGPALYPDSFEPAEGELTPNTSLPDATAPIAPENVVFTQTPADSWRQGRLTWTHPSPNSVINFIVKVSNEEGFSRTFAPVELEQSLSNIPLGDYTLEVGAINRYGKQAFSSPLDITISSTPTPEGVTTQVLTGKLIVTGPPLPHDAATYDWRYAYDGVFASSYDGGRDVALTIHDTPQNGSVTIWYRLIDGERADANWTSFVVGPLIGLIQMTNNGNGTYTISTDTMSIIIRDGNDGDIPTVTDNGDGTYTIEGANGQTVTVSDGEPGYSPTKGVDYFDGLNGDFVSYIYRNSINKPATPSGGSFDGSTENFPNGWTDTRTAPAEGYRRWVSTVRYSDNGDGTWMKRTAWSEAAPDFEKGDPGPAPTVTDNGNGSYTITSGEDSITILDGAAGDIPTFTDNGDGTYTITNALGETITVRDGDDGFSPQKGVDYFDGVNGDYVSFVFKNAASKPATPTGGSFDGSSETFPSGTTDTRSTPPAGQKRWVSTVRYKDDGDGTWSRRSAWSAFSEDFERGDKGDDGAAGADGLTPSDIVGVAGQVWGFTEDDNYLDWNLTNLNNASVVRGSLHATATNNDPYIAINDLAIVGADNYGIKVRLRTSSATHNTTAQLYWTNSSHGHHDNYRCTKSIRYQQDEWTYLIFDIRDANTTTARDDWMNSVITGIRIDLANENANGKSYEIDHIVVGYFGSVLPPVDDDDATPAPTNLIGNPKGAIADRHGRAQGWKPCEGGFDYDKIRYYAGKKALRCGSQSYTNVAFAYKAVAVNSDTVYRLRLWLSSEHVQTGGVYIRLLELNSELPANKTHVVNSTHASTPHGVARNSYKSFHSNGGVDDEPQLFDYDYTPPASVKYVSLAIYRWSGNSGWNGGAAANVWIHHAEMFVKEAAASVRNDQLSSENIRQGAGWGTLPASGANYVSDSHIDGRANSRIGALRPDDDYRNSRTTASQVGLGSVPNWTPDGFRNEAVNRALQNTMLRNPSGYGDNFCNPKYFDPRTGIPLVTGNVTSTLIHETYANRNGDRPNIEGCYRYQVTNGDAWMLFGRSTTDYNIAIPPNKKWLVSFYVFRQGSSSLGYPKFQAYLRTPNGYTGSPHTASFTEYQAWRRISVIVDLTNDASTSAALRIDVDDCSAGQVVLITAPMPELYRNDGNATPSALAAPPTLQPILRSRLLPTSNNMGTPAAANSSSLSSDVDPSDGNKARIDIAAHSVTVSNESISYNSGTVYSLEQGTTYHVYCFDPYGVGGNVSYYATTNGASLARDDIYKVGKFTTYVNGGGTTRPDPGDCPHADTWLTPTLQAKDAKVGDVIDAVTNGVKHKAPIIGICPATEDVITFITVSGNQKTVSLYTPVDMRDGSSRFAVNLKRGDEMLAEMPDGELVWEPVVDKVITAAQPVMHISLGGTNFLGGVSADKRLVTHNIFYKP